MIFRSRTTKQLSNVMEQNALRRSPGSSMSLMRTSVISMVHSPCASTRDLLATASSVDKPELPRLKNTGQTPCVLCMTTNAEISGTTAGKLMCYKIEFSENSADGIHPG